MRLPILYSFILSQLLQSLNANPAYECKAAYDAASQRFFAFDHDGTLITDRAMTPGVTDSVHRAEKQRAKELLRNIAADRKNEVWVITARGIRALDDYAGISRLNLAGELGGVIRRAGGSETLYYDFAAETEALGDIIKEEIPNEAEKTLITRKTGSIIFQYPPNEFSNVHAKMEELGEAENSPYKYASHETFSTLTHKDCNKGKLISDLLKKYEGPYFGICMGDTATDAPMFHAMNEHSKENDATTLSILVSSNQNIDEATHRLESPNEVFKFFEELTSA